MLSTEEAALVSLSILGIGVAARQLHKKKKNKSKIWSRAWLQRRDENKGILNMLNTELKIEDPGSYQNYLRLTSNQFEDLLNLIAADIKKEDTYEKCHYSKKLPVTLRFLETVESFWSLMYSTRISESAISRFVPEVCKAIIKSLNSYIETPNSEDTWKKISDDFLRLWQFPHCLGAIDGRHITFTAPISDGSYYYNYKGTLSIILLAMADAIYKFTYINLGVNGRISDGGVFQRCSLNDTFKTNALSFPKPEAFHTGAVEVPYVIVGDDSFPLSANLLKPYSQRQLDHDSRIFNYRLSRARRIIENAFGILANRFRVLLNPIHLSPQKVELITLTCICLHNYILNGNFKQYTFDAVSMECDLPQVVQQGGNKSTADARKIRDEFRHFVNSPFGTVEWQENAIKNFNM